MSLNDSLMLLGVIVWLLTLVYFIVVMSKYFKGLSEDLETEKDFLKEKIRNEMRINIQSLNFSKEYHDELCTLLERLED